MRRINFHIGAPRVAAGVIQSLSALKAVQSAEYLEVLTPEEYREHFGHVVTASDEVPDLTSLGVLDEDPFWVRLDACQLMAASQPTIMGRPKMVFRDGLILPQTERWIHRLSQIFAGTQLDLHLTITNQVDYIRLLQKDVDPSDILGQFDDRAPSWYELVVRIKRTCPQHRLLVWDFTDPAKVALPFAMEMIGFDEKSADLLMQHVNEAIRVDVLLSKILKRDVVHQDIQDVLDAQYDKDLQNIGALEDTILIQPGQIPQDLHIKVR